MLKEPLLILVTVVLCCKSVGVLGDVGLPILSGGRSLVFKRFHIITSGKVVSFEDRLLAELQPWL